jgi:small subunit ribosomal protein S20
MPHSASAKKRHRQNLRNRERNRAVKSDLKSQVRKVLDAISSGDVTQAKEHFRTVTKKADRAAAAKTIHRNRAARLKSRLSARVKAASQGEGTAVATKTTASKARKSAKS